MISEEFDQQVSHSRMCGNTNLDVKFFKPMVSTKRSYILK